MRWITLSLVLILSVGTPVMAHCGQCQGDGEEAVERPQRGGPGEHAGPGGGPAMRAQNDEARRPRPDITAVLSEMELTDDQIEAVRTVLKEHHDAMREWQEDNREAMKAIREKMKELHAAEERDEEAIKALRDEMAELMSGTEVLREQLETDLGEVLTAEQVEAVLEAIRPQRGRPGHGSDRAAGEGPGRGADMLSRILVGELALTDEQKAKIKAIVENERADGEVQRPMGDRHFRLAKQIAEEVLTDDQREFLDAYKAAMIDGAALRHLDLSEEQRKVLRELHQATREAMDNASTAEEMLTVLENARTTVNDEILTAEQVEQLKTSRELAEKMEALMSLEFSEEQRKALGELRRATAEALEAADSAQARLNVLSEALETAQQDILTDAQRESLNNE